MSCTSETMYQLGPISSLKQQRAWRGSGTKGNILLCNSCKWPTMLSGA